MSIYLSFIAKQGKLHFTHSLSLLQVPALLYKLQANLLFWLIRLPHQVKQVVPDQRKHKKIFMWSDERQQ